MYHDHASFLQSFTLRLTGGDRHWAEDVTQETLVRAWRLADRLQENGPSHILPWLITVARRIVLNDLRARRCRPQEVLGTRLDASSTLDEMERALHRRLIIDALAKIGEAHRTVLVAIYLRGQSTEEVARLLGVPLGTVKSRCYYGLRALREVLRQQGVSPNDYTVAGRAAA
jgi:RNA polymerase sigma-70 factor (ECF subfamily)